MRSDAELSGLIIQNAWRDCRVSWYEDQVIDIRNGTDPQAFTALQYLVQSFAESGSEDDNDAVSIQLVSVDILDGCDICIMTLVS